MYCKCNYERHSSGKALQVRLPCSESVLGELKPSLTIVTKRAAIFCRESLLAQVGLYHSCPRRLPKFGSRGYPSHPHTGCVEMHGHILGSWRLRELWFGRRRGAGSSDGLTSQCCRTGRRYVGRQLRRAVSMSVSDRPRQRRRVTCETPDNQW